MTEMNRERSLILFLAIALVLGVAFDFAGDDVESPERVPVEGLRLHEQASLCPAPIDTAKGTSQVTVGAPSDATTRYSMETSGEEGLLELQGPAARVVSTREFGAAVGYRQPVVASSTFQVSDPVEGAGAARCSRVASTRWYFPEGSSALGFDERLILYNPFPDEAVARITFSTPTGDVNRARLAEGIPVPSGDVRVVKVNDFVPPQNTLGSVVEMSRGRVVAWRASLLDPKEQPGGLQFTLGARAPAATWYLPAGSIEEGIDERLALMNPGRKEAVLSISLVGAKETIQPPKLVEVRVPPETTIRLVLADLVGKGQQSLGGVGAVVRSTNGGEVVAERTLWYELAAVEGVSSEIGAAVARTRWMVGPALMKPATDTLLLLNPGPDPARADVSVLDEKGPAARPGYLQNIKLKPGTRRRIEIRELGAMLLVTSDAPVVAERSATVGRDAAAVMGVPTAE